GFSGTAARLNSAGNAYPDRVNFSGMNRFQITGTAANDSIATGGGNDTINAGAGKDTLTGGLGADKFVYQNFTDSLLADFDVITDFNATTGNDLFRVSTARAGFVNVGAVNTLDAAGMGAKLTAAAFGSNFAAQFSFGRKTFVAINDATAGFNAAKPLLLQIQVFCNFAKVHVPTILSITTDH
ncbi:MAG: bluetail domain-containing putative surface protein, partial [Dolichospermum lemmermannii FEM_B0920]